MPRATTLTYASMQASRSVPAPLRQLPNALTILRFAAIPLFVVLLARDQDGPSWPAGIVFAVAGITDQIGQLWVGCGRGIALVRRRS